MFCTHKTIPTGAWYVTLHMKIRQREINILSLAQENGFSRVYLLSLVRLVNGAWYVILHMKIRQREVNILQFGSGKWFFTWIFAQFGEAGTRFLVCDPAH
jgi:hypothetical protein